LAEPIHSQDPRFPDSPSTAIHRNHDRVRRTYFTPNAVQSFLRNHFFSFRNCSFIEIERFNPRNGSSKISRNLSRWSSTTLNGGQFSQRGNTPTLRQLRNFVPNGP